MVIISYGNHFLVLHFCRLWVWKFSVIFHIYHPALVHILHNIYTIKSYTLCNNCCSRRDYLCLGRSGLVGLPSILIIGSNVELTSNKGLVRKFETKFKARQGLVHKTMPINNMNLLLVITFLES